MPRTWNDSFATRREQRKRGMKFGTWNVRNQYRSKSLMTVAKELARYKQDLVGVQKVGVTKGALYEQGLMLYFQ